MSRQIPQEAVFISSDNQSSRRDLIKKNRYHFKFPINWTTSIKQESIVGIRSMYITPRYRTLNLSITIQPYEEDMSGNVTKLDKLEQTVTVHMAFDDNVLLKDFINLINDGVERIMEVEVEGKKWKDYLPYGSVEPPIYALYTDSMNHKIDDTTLITDDTAGTQSKFVIYNSYNNLKATSRTETDYVDGGIGTYSNIYSVSFRIVHWNTDTEQFLNYKFNYDTEFKDYDALIAYDVYDYNQCILYSNLADSSENSFLGHTRKYNLSHFKYYEIKNSNQSFWVDLYSTSSHKVPVYLPEGDEFYIEAQLLTSSTSLI